MSQDKFKLRKLHGAYRTLLICILLSMLIGYLLTLLQVYEHTGFSASQVILNYRGSPNPDLMAIAKPYREVLQNTHAHIFSVPLLYFILGAIFLGAGLSVVLKQTLIVLLFSGHVLEYTALWLLRYVHEDYIWLCFGAHGLTGSIFFIMIVINLIELCGRRIE